MKTKVLIVDDIKENIVALDAIISSPDLEIFHAQDADTALNLVFEHEFALALLDVQMPSLTGFDLARLIRGVERSRHLPIIFVTAQDKGSSIEVAGYEMGAVDLLFKPLDPHVVRSKVRVFVMLDQPVPGLDHLKAIDPAALCSACIHSETDSDRLNLDSLFSFSTAAGERSWEPRGKPRWRPASKGLIAVRGLLTHYDACIQKGEASSGGIPSGLR